MLKHLFLVFSTDIKKEFAKHAQEIKKNKEMRDENLESVISSYPPPTESYLEDVSFSLDL